MRKFLLLTLALAGCTTAKTMMVSDREAIISGRDMGWGDAGDVKRKVLESAANMGRARGYDYFMVTSAEDRTRSGYVAVPGRSTSNTNGSASCTSYSCTGSATTNGYQTPGYIAPYTKAGVDVTIHFYHAGEIDPTAAHVYSVAAILQK